MNAFCVGQPGLVWMSVALVVVVALGATSVAAVPESARKIPVAYDVDVVVVGGGVSAVSAATAAAKDGAKVFLAAPRPYLGEDLAGTLRVWVGGDVAGQDKLPALAAKLFAASGRSTGGGGAVRKIPNAYKLKYSADLPSARVHPDTRKPSRLTDGRWSTPTKESVQYDGNVNIVADLGKVRDVDKAHAMVFHAKDFLVATVTVSTSDDGKAWKDVETIKCTAQKGTDMTAAEPFVATIGAKTRYVRFAVKHTADSTRVLVGEIAVTRPTGAPVVKPKPKTADKVHLIRPLHIKRTLDEALIEAGVSYLFGCYATDVLRDVAGKPAGIVMANRAGRQAVRAKVIIDATDRAWVARMAGAKARPFPAGKQTFKRVVVGGELVTGEGVVGRQVPGNFKGFGVFEYTLELPMPDGSFRSFAAAEQRARDLTYHDAQQSAADLLFQVPPDAIQCVKTVSGEWAGAEEIDLDAFRPAGLERLLILGGCADVGRDQAAKLLEPLSLIVVGSRVGRAAAAEAKKIPAPKKVTLTGKPAQGAGDIRELLDGVRPFGKKETIDQAGRALPVLGRYDVVVVGGGTAGAPAGIAAARRGAKTLVLEYQCALGGVGTIGRISSYYWGNRGGFTASVPGGGKWSVERRMEWWRREIRKAGGEIWFGVLGCGAYVEGGRVRGAVVATPQGRGVVLAKAVIDATGNADVAASAGAKCIYTDATDVALQGTGLPPHQLGRQYTNTDYTLVDETDMLDVWHVYVYGKRMAGNAFDFGKLIDTRERRRVVGEFTISIFDEVLSRTHPDTVVQAYSNFDTHGYTVHPYFTLNYPHKKGLATHIPLRAMLPKGMEGILVVGLGISAHRDAIPVIRMQPDIQNGGYAAGTAAAMAAKADSRLRSIDLKALQKHLVEIGNLKADVLTARDSFPLPPDRIAAAVNKPKDAYKDMAVILSHPKQSLPLVRQAFASASAKKDKLRWAQVLSVLGDSSGLETIIAALEAHDKLDAGWKYRGMGQFGSSMSPLDSLIYALGRIRDKRAAGAIVKKLKLLKPQTEFSHYRAIAIALERIGDRCAAAPLAEVLAQPGVRGQAIADIKAALDRADKHSSWTATVPRANALRELFLARALYRLGDQDGLGKKVLTEYTQDLRGHFARHAHAVLNE